MGVYAPNRHNVIARLARLAFAHFDERRWNGGGATPRSEAMKAAYRRLETSLSELRPN